MFNRLRIIPFTIILAFVLVACGANEPEGTPEPTATPFPTFEFVAPTNPPIFDTTPTVEAAAEAAATPDTRFIDRGRGRYEALECAVCHGENGEGTDDGSILISLELNEADFISFMRSGGDIGSEHQYSTDRLSENGSRNLYLYLMSLEDSEN